MDDNNISMNEVCIPNIVLKSSLKKYQNFLNIAHVNGGSIFGKLDEVRQIISNTPLSALCISETWFTKSVNDSEIKIDGYYIIRNDRSDPLKDRGGGVAIYIRNNIQSNILEIPKSLKTDIIVAELIIAELKVLIIVIYKPPNVYAFNDIENIVNKYNALYEDIIIIGDLNINALDDHNFITKSFQNFLSSSSLSIINNEPTHFTANSSSQIDYIIANNIPKILFCNQIGVPGISRHDLIYCSYKIPQPNEKEQIWFYRSFKDIDMINLEQEISNMNWQIIYDHANINQKITIFNDYINYLFDRYVPIKKSKCLKNGNIWFDSNIKRSLVERDLAYMHWKRTKLPEDHLHFKNLRNRATQMIRTSKSQYFSNKFPVSSTAKELWKNLENLGIQDSTQFTEIKLSENDLNDFFSKPPSSSILPSPNINDPSGSFAFPSFSFCNIISDDVSKSINQIKSNAIGLDNIAIKFIKLIFHNISDIVTHIFNHAITTSSFPSAWKIAKIIPIPKISSPVLPSDFRPISILPALSKAFEKILKSQINDYVNQHNLLNKFQSGFRQKHGTNTALLKICDDLYQNVEDKKLTVLVLLDFSKAFDSVPHSHLLHKLSKLFNFSSSAVSLLESYLSERTQRVFCNNKFSKSSSVKIGVPQGSILGPLLFSLYINDLPLVLKYSKFHIFADDFQIYLSFYPEDMQIGLNNLNHDLNLIRDWACKNGLLLNDKKTQAMVVTHQNLNILEVPPVIINGSTILYVEKVRNLGVIINKNLRWEDNTNKICSKIYFVLRRLWRYARFLPYHTRQQLFLSLLLPHFIYGSVVYCKLNYLCSYKIKMAFNACVRFVFLLRKYDHISNYTNRLLHCSILTYQDILCLVFLYKLIKSKTPFYLFNILQFCHSSRTLNLVVPMHHYLSTSNSFFVHGIKLWNNLPIDLKLKNTVDGFKKGCLCYFQNS